MIERIFDKSIELKDNAMLKARPELFYEWDFEKNDELGMDVYEITLGSNKMAWWKCPKCKGNYDMKIYNRAGKKKANCPYCSHQRLHHSNSFATLFPDIAKEWHPTLNGTLTPHDIIGGGGNRIAWWISESCGHEWNDSIGKRTGRNKGCPYCATFNARLLVGFNDMWTTNPELASLLLNPDDGYKYMRMSGAKVDWKCPECNNTIENKNIRDVNIDGLSCPRCSDGIKFPEKFMYNLLRKFNIDFSFDEAQKWSEGKRYDFYLPKYNWIIETHGGQHFNENGFSSAGGRTLEQEVENDKLKHEFAKENGVDKYIVIDCRESTVDWIKNSILGSDIMKILNEEDIDFEEIGVMTTKSLVKTACDLWNIGNYSSALQISYEMNIHPCTAIVYLKRGAEIGWCNYSSKIKRDVVQLDSDMTFIRIWKSLAEAERFTRVDSRRISDACRGNRKESGGFKWMYKEDYDKLVSNQQEII